ncbi:VOC family protein [Nonomuraea soli]|uniref:VOC domain-containing protein n=1 Tax=Nonomuraea soli TaxID=1032476 RepID=A0A7W0HSK7_9ACTN|nr:VOC family protein [Nonomuraea soli]MBA2894100.1 hypothetical protein [Nonomuraea soli]
MTSRIAQWTLDVADSGKMAAFSSAALGYRIEHGGEGPHLWPPDDAPPETPTVWLQPTHESKRGKNRSHPDLYVLDGGDVEAEVERLIALGATRADVGQTGDEGFVVMADPEGNEFCLLYRKNAWG